MLQIILFIFNSILFFIRHAYPETAYITAAPTGTIGPITVRHYELFKSFFLFLFHHRVCAIMFVMLHI